MKENQQNERKIKATLQKVPKEDKNGLETSMCLQSFSFLFSQVCLQLDTVHIEAINKRTYVIFFF